MASNFQKERRAKMRQLYGVIPRPDLETNTQPPRKPETFIAPDPSRDAPGPAATCAKWPFDAATATRMQGADGRQTLDLGKTADGKPLQIDVVRIPAGTFVMGNHAGPRDERPEAAVTIGAPFWMATKEISNALYALYDPQHDSYRYDGHPGSGGVPAGIWSAEGIGPRLFNPDQPVVRVNWEEANGFCRWLSKKLGRRVLLPSEAQWEWACRAGTATPFWFGPAEADFSGFANLADLSWEKVTPANISEAAKRGVELRFGKNGMKRAFDKRFFDGNQVTAPVGYYKPNPWGLYDMHGNVGEWTRSAYKPYPYREDDGRHNDNVTEDKAVRGGTWYDRPDRATSSFRNYRPAWMQTFDVGFRVIIED
jgi:formylglycine-generating enzyme required for sulfatase activity